MDFDFEEDITREQLKELELKEGGNIINWELWDKLVEQSKKFNEEVDNSEKAKQLADYRKHVINRGKLPIKNPKIKRFVYTFSGKLLYTDYAWHLSEILNLTENRITYLANLQHICYTHELWFSNFKETPASIRSQVNKKLKRWKKDKP